MLSHIHQLILYAIVLRYIINAAHKSYSLFTVRFELSVVQMKMNSSLCRNMSLQKLATGLMIVVSYTLRELHFRYSPLMDSTDWAAKMDVMTYFNINRTIFTKFIIFGDFFSSRRKILRFVA